jgi:Na+-transporting NADH:ubiquinone oxidoreductase subunit C
LSDPSQKTHSNFQVLLFVVFLCVSCAFLLSLAAYLLADQQQAAKDFDQSKQMLIAAKILNHQGYFEILQDDGTTLRSRFDARQSILIPDLQAPRATEAEIKKVAAVRIRPLLADKSGVIHTFEDQHLSLSDYLAENKKGGYAQLPLKLFYALLPNETQAAAITAAALEKDLKKASGFVIPVSGFGLWAPIYGFLALRPDGNTVIGTTWYEHGETPGLGANITEAWWQKLFYGKVIFQETPGGSVDFKTADMGIIVVKGKVRDVYGNSPKSKSAVDGMSGATLTGDGVTQAFRNSLSPYRAFFINLQTKK